MSDGYKSVPTPKPISYINTGLMQASLKGYEKNNFVSFLKLTFGEALTTETVKRYKIGTSTAISGANVFWYIDKQQKVRGGKIMHYNPTTGKRGNYFSWTHTKLKLDDFNLKLCFYGEHLLSKYPLKDVGIVESEKTAIISSMVFPNLIWLASGGKNGINTYKFQSLKNRNVYLFPDLSKTNDKETCFEIWVKELERIQDEITGYFLVSDYFESRATIEEKDKGLDLADYILLKNWHIENVRNEQNESIEKPFNLTEKIQINNGEQSRIIKKQIEEVVQSIKAEREKESSLKDQIRDCEIPSGAILKNKELLKKYRHKHGY